ncbi:MAG: transporter substrate-binding domain-containing protein [bacterium]|nr:transporter substrate-binding domain-containing protein [bacterium]
MRRRLTWLALLIALGLIASACASDESDGDMSADMSSDIAALNARINSLESEMASAGSGVVAGNLLDEIKDEGVLTVGMVLQFEPQMYINDAGEPAGYDVDLMNMLAEDLGVELDIQNLEFDAMIPGLIARQYDMVSVGLVGRPARLEQLWFTCPYVPYRQVVVVNDGAGLMSIDDLNSSDVTMTALTGSTAANLTETRFPNAELIQLDQAPAFLEVASGRADAIVVEEYLALPFVAENPGTSVLNPNAPFVAEEYGAWAVPRGEVVWLEYLNGWLAYYISRGTLDEVYERHIGPTEGMPACN